MITERDKANFSLADASRDYPLIPQRIISGLGRYYYFGIEPGSFTAAVLRGEILAILIADRHFENGAAFKELVAFLWDNFPRGIWGSGEKVRKHIESFYSEESESSK